MLAKLLAELNNWFIVPDGIHHDTFTVEGSALTLPFLRDGQYFRVLGSVFNDGLYRYPAADLIDETFEGTVWALAVPKAVVELSDSIAAWQEQNGNNGPYTSESFDGYSYTKATTSKGKPLTWREAFAGDMKEWRKARCLF